MTFASKNLLGFPITIEGKEKVLEKLKKGLGLGIRNQESGIKKEAETIVIFTPNPEIIAYAQKEPNFIEIVRSAQINIPDGWGIVWALKRLYGLEIPKITGVDFMLDLCEISAKEGFRVGLIGGWKGVALACRECLISRFPRLEVEVLGEPDVRIEKWEARGEKWDNEVRSGISRNLEIKDSHFNISHPISHFTRPTKNVNITSLYFQKLIEEIERKRIHILFVALGFPKQEYFIRNIQFQISNFKFQKPLVLMAVGGAFDSISGRVKRAPLWMREKRLEWLYRLGREPWRLGRQFRGGKFFWRVLKESKGV